MSPSQEVALTIIIPTRDRPKLLAAAVQSVLLNMPNNTELLVVDDRSVIPAAGSIPEFAPRLRVTVSQAKPGAAGARNWGVAHALGQRILFLDDDDLMIPGYPDWVLQQKADYGFAPILSFRGMAAPDMSAFPGGQGSPVADVRPFRHQMAGLGCGFWIERKVFLATGGICEDIPVNEDTEFSIRLLKAGLQGLRAPAPAVMVRKHGGIGGERSHLTNAANASERAGYFGEILSRHADWLTDRPDASRHLLQRQLKLLALARDKDGALKVLNSPLARSRWIRLRLYYLAEVFSARMRRR